jgi:hypothetical protein
MCFRFHVKGDTPTLGHLERANLGHWITHAILIAAI